MVINPVTDFLVAITQCSDITTGIANNNLRKAVLVFPNPTRGNFTVSFEEPQYDVTIHIFNIFGEEVFFEIYPNTLLKKEISMHVSPGIYFMQVSNRKILFNQKLIVE